MLPVRLRLCVPSRNVPFVWEDAFVDGALPYDFTGHDARMEVRMFAGDTGTALLTLDKVTDDAEGIRFIQATDAGTLDGLRITIDADSLQGLPGLNTPEAGNAQTFYFDLLDTPPSQPERVLLTGDLILSPGVTV